MSKKIILSQIGARHRYEIAKILYKNNFLLALYTDSSSYSHLGRLSKIFKKYHPAILKLSKRIIHDIPRNKVKSTDVLFFKNLFKKQRTFKQINLENHKIFSKRAIKWGVKDADFLYHMYLENLDFVKFAKSKGVKIITDVYISPITEDIMIQEHKNYPFLKNVNYNKEDNKIYKEKVAEVIALTDVLLCPSTWVAQGVLKINPNVKDKIKIVPYGSSITFNNIENKPILGRFLFVGYDVSRKGLIYLAKAATILKKYSKDIDIRIAGLSKVGELNHSIFKDLNFLGKLDLENLKKEYATADAFVLPSFSEGLAGVLVEAMSAGLPIIATQSSGVDFIDQENGLVIQSGNTNDIVNSCKVILNNRELRGQLAKKSKQMSNFYTIDSWEKRLVDFLKEL